MTFPDIATKPALTAESRGVSFCRKLERSDYLVIYGTLNTACWKLKFVFKKHKV